MQDQSVLQYRPYIRRRLHRKSPILSRGKGPYMHVIIYPYHHCWLRQPCRWYPTLKRLRILWLAQWKVVLAFLRLLTWQQKQGLYCHVRLWKTATKTTGCARRKHSA